MSEITLDKAYVAEEPLNSRRVDGTYHYIVFEPPVCEFEPAPGLIVRLASWPSWHVRLGAWLFFGLRFTKLEEK